MARRILAERHSAEAALLSGQARVVEIDGVLAAGPERLRKVDEDGVDLSLVFQRDLSEQDLVDAEVGVEIQLDPSVVLQHPEADRVPTGD